MVWDAIIGYLHANDGSKWEQITEKTKILGNYGELVKYLLMVKGVVKKLKVDSELVNAFANDHLLAELDEFINRKYLVSKM